MPDAERTKLLGALSYRPRWGLTLRGCLLLLALFILLGGGFVLAVYPFLAITDKADARLLVVEGWLSPAAIPDALREFRDGGYGHLYVTGGPIEGESAEYRTFAEQGAVRLRKQGLEPRAMTEVPGPKVVKDRTYTSAVALRDLLHGAGQMPGAINVFSHGPHARRSRLLFQKAFGPGTRIGIIAAPPHEYRAERWWASSAGVKDMISETSAYLYARLLFWP